MDILNGQITIVVRQGYDWRKYADTIAFQFDEAYRFRPDAKEALFILIFFKGLYAKHGLDCVQKRWQENVDAGQIEFQQIRTIDKYAR